MPGPSFRRCRSSLLIVLAAAAPAAARAQTPAPAAPLRFAQTPAPAEFPPLPEAAPDKRFVPPKTLKRLPVAYPELAHLNRVEGVVHILFSIDETGRVTRAIVNQTSGSVMLDAVVLDYNLLHWTFEPATLDAKPVPSTKTQEIEFRLDPAEERALALKRLALPVGTPDAPYPKEAIPYKLRGSATVGVRWTKLGLVDRIFLAKASGSKTLDNAALRWAYENWHIDPAAVADKNKGEPFTKTLNFEPPP